MSSRSGSFTINKGVTNLALDVLKFALDGAEIKQEGDRFVHLQSELGERRYTKLCEDVDLALEEIHYCQEGLDIVRINAQVDEHGQEIVSPAQVEQMRQMKDLINHDYLVLELRPGAPTAEVMHIMAHKLRGGIHITHIPSSDVTSVFHDGVRCFTVACRKKRIRLEALVAILKEEDPDYSLRNANCWDYAKNTAKRLVKGCVEVPGISSAEKARLQAEHDNLEANLTFHHFQNVAKSLLRNVARNSSRVSTPAVPLELPSVPRARNSLRIWDSSEGLMDRLPQALELSSLPRARNSLRVSDSSKALMDLSPQTLELSSTPMTLNAFKVSNPSEGLMDRTPQVQELSSSPADRSNSSEVLNPSRSVDLLFSEPANPTRLNSFSASNSSGGLPRAAPELSSSLVAPPANLASTGRLCLQIVFLVLCLVINNLGLGPWASTLLGASNSG